MKNLKWIIPALLIGPASAGDLPSSVFDMCQSVSGIGYTLARGHTRDIPKELYLPVFEESKADLKESQPEILGDSLYRWYGAILDRAYRFPKHNEELFQQILFSECIELVVDKLGSK